MVSFYTLPSTVMHHPTHKFLKAAYSFYNVSTKTQLCDLMNDALILAKRVGFLLAFYFQRFVCHEMLDCFSSMTGNKYYKTPSLSVKVPTRRPDL